MTYGPAVVGLLYDATDLQEDPPGVFLEIVRGLNEPGEVRGTDTVVPARAGRIPRGRVWDRLLLELRGYVAGTGSTEDDARADFRERADGLRTLFAPTRVPALLVAQLEDGSAISVSARPLNMVYDLVLPAWQRVSVELEAVEDWAPAGS